MEKSDLPMLTALRPNEHLRYRSKVSMDRLDQDYISRWVSAVIKREEKPWVRSEKELDTSGPLVELVGTNYDQFTKDPTKEVFVDYYAPWCSHCQNLAPTYEQLALYYQYDKDLVIARFDATKNDVVGDWIKGYPTLVLYPLGENSKPIEYNGARDFNAMSKWLKSKSEVLKNRSTIVKEDL